ncbi:hypothetical protein [Nocardioides marmoraquaticus]
MRIPGRLAHWGATAGERRTTHAADRHVPPGGEHLVRAVDVDAAPETVHRWLCQLSVAPYSYDLVDNLGRRSPRTLTPGAERLEVGQHVLIGPLAEVVPGRGFVTVAGPLGRRLLGDIAMGYEVVPGERARSRILVCLALGPRRRHSLGVWRTLLAAGDLVMIRKQLHTLRALAEGR